MLETLCDGYTFWMCHRMTQFRVRYIKPQVSDILVTRCGQGQSGGCCNVQVLMVATDVYRPAAIEQLVMLGQRVSVPVFEMGTDAKPADIAAAGLAKAKAEGYDAIIVDTAGRLQVRAPCMGQFQGSLNGRKLTQGSGLRIFLFKVNRYPSIWVSRS